MITQGYGAREVPNVQLIFLNKGTPIYTLYIDTVCEYYENINDKENYVKIEWVLINPEDYDFIVAHQYTEVLLYRAMIIRSSETGNDKLYFPPTLHFNNTEFEYSLEPAGDPVKWTLILRG